MQFKNNNIEIVQWDKKIEQQSYELLHKYEETSLFMLANLKAHGPKLTAASYSGNLKCLIQDDHVVAVFVLTRVGNLLIQTDRNNDYSEIIVDVCMKESIAFRGVIGEWDLAKQIWDCVKNKITSLKPIPCKKSILFQLVLNNLPYFKTSYNIKYLDLPDYAEWSSLNNAFLSERNLNQSEGESAKYERFLNNTKQKYLLGLFVNKKLVATASFTACLDKTGQIGDVYTIPAMRKHGLAKELVYQLALDGKMHKHLEKVVLFTSEDNYPAIKLYEKLGFIRIGYFGLLFWETNHE